MFRKCLAWKMISTIVVMIVQVIGLNAILSLGNKRCRYFSSNNMFAYFATITST